MRTKRPTEDSAARVIRLAGRFLRLPLTASIGVVAWVRARLQGLKSDKRVRDEDQLRQSRVRRGLRGLLADHVPGSRPDGTSHAKRG